MRKGNHMAGESNDGPQDDLPGWVKYALISAGLLGLMAFLVYLIGVVDGRW